MYEFLCFVNVLKYISLYRRSILIENLKIWEIFCPNFLCGMKAKRAKKDMSCLYGSISIFHRM